MITKEQIHRLKNQGDPNLIDMVKGRSDSKSILFLLKNLGHLPQNFDDAWIIPLLSNRNKQVRFWAAKTLGKTQKEDNIPILQTIAQKDESTEVRREAVSSIGRLRSQNSIPILLEFLEDANPKIILQAIRGLMVFQQDPIVRARLQPLRKHPNETIQKLIEKTYFSIQKGNTMPQQPHSESYNFLKNVVVLGDVRQTLKVVPDETFHLTFTSPPYYNSRDYSIYKSYQEYLNFLEEVFCLTHQKTKEGRFLIVNTSPVIVSRVSRQHASKRYPIPFDIHGFLIKTGWEFIDDIVWEKPETSVKNRNAGFLQHRKPLAYKPNPVTEYLMVYRKETDKLIDWNIRQYGRKTIEISKVKDGYETSNVWKIQPKSDKVHSAVFPVDLCQRVIQYYSFRGDLLFDPFAGSGTSGRTAQTLGRFFFLTERERKYFEYMKTFLDGNRLFDQDKFQIDFLTLAEFMEKAKI